MAQAIRATKPGGTVVSAVNATIGAFPFAVERTLVGSLLGSRRQMRTVLELAAAGKVGVVAEAYPLEQAQDVLRRLKAGEIRARAVLTLD
jgi:propanol-preferring alcohol dehydrogenase